MNNCSWNQAVPVALCFTPWDFKLAISWKKLKFTKQRMGVIITDEASYLLQLSDIQGLWLSCDSPISLFLSFRDRSPIHDTRKE